MALRVREKAEAGPRVAEARLVEGCRTAVKVREFPELVADEPADRGGTDAGPTPLEYVTAGLAACQAVTIAKIAGAMRFAYQSLDVRAETEVDWIESQKGSGRIPRFTKAQLVVEMTSGEPEERLARLKELVEERCPASNLFETAGIAPAVVWQVRQG